MAKITVSIGSFQVGHGGQVNSTLRPVEFEGEMVAQYVEYGTHEGNVSDARGVTQTLYRIAEDRLVVHVEAWSRWLGETTVTSLHQVVLPDLQVSGRFEALGHKAGFGRPLTLDEALGE